MNKIMMLEPLFQAFTLSQLVKSPTRGSRVLDIFATYVPFYFGKDSMCEGPSEVRPQMRDSKP